MSDGGSASRDTCGWMAGRDIDDRHSSHVPQCWRCDHV